MPEKLRSIHSMLFRDNPEVDDAGDALEEKPYNTCIYCNFLNTKRCDGPNFLTMTPERRCEWCQMRKAYLHQREPDKWTYKYIAEKSLCSEATVKRVINDPSYEPRTSTLASIIMVLGGSCGQYPCALLSMSDTEIAYVESPELLRALEERDATIERLRDNYNSLKGSLEREVSVVRQEFQAKVDFLKEQVNKKDAVIEKLLNK